MPTEVTGIYTTERAREKEKGDSIQLRETDRQRQTDRQRECHGDHRKTKAENKSAKGTKSITPKRQQRYTTQPKETFGESHSKQYPRPNKTVNVVHRCDQPNKNTRSGAGEKKQMLILRGSIRNAKFTSFLC